MQLKIVPIGGKHYSKHLQAGITSLILNKGAATHFVVYESQFVAASTFTSVVKWTATTVAGLELMTH